MMLTHSSVQLTNGGTLQSLKFRSMRIISRGHRSALRWISYETQMELGIPLKAVRGRAFYRAYVTVDFRCYRRYRRKWIQRYGR